MDRPVKIRVQVALDAQTYVAFLETIHERIICVKGWLVRDGQLRRVLVSVRLE
jgi:hypothetical protein